LKNTFAAILLMSWYHTQGAEDPKAVSLVKGNPYSQQSRQGSKSK